jgi:hypothetical protein
VLDETQPAINVETVDDDRWRRGWLIALPLFQDTPVVVYGRLGTQPTDDSKCCHVCR